MLMVPCDLTGEDGECTICTGIVGADGVRRGALADVDVFSAFNVETGKNKLDMWEVKEIRDRTVINRRACEVVDSGKPTVEELGLYYAICNALISENCDD
jgi:hypothetical protein